MEAISPIVIVLFFLMIAIAIIVGYIEGYDKGVQDGTQKENTAIIERARESRCEDDYISLEDEAFRRLYEGGQTEGLSSDRDSKQERNEADD